MRKSLARKEGLNGMSDQAFADLIIRMVDIDPRSGKMTWKPRQPSDFTGKRRDPIFNCLAWNARHVGKSAFNVEHGDGYLHGRFQGKNVLAHVAAWCLYHGSFPKGDVRHQNGDRSDNSLHNLYVTSHMVASWDQAIAKNNTSGIKGVSWHKRVGAWQARIMADGEMHHLGYFEVLGEAKKARDAAERHFYGRS